ncbi:hypothetical protein V498_05217, partial [Pseudogymnoascus sp. VKM F-4517 (FW-2822)]
RRPRPIPQRMVPIQHHGVVATPQRPADELGPELEQVLADLAAGAGEAVEGVEVDVRGY